MRYSGCRLSTTAHSFGTAVGHPIWVWSKPQRTPQKSYFDRVYEPYLGVKEEWVLEKQSIAGISPRKRAVACHGTVFLTDFVSFFAIFNLEQVC